MEILSDAIFKGNVLIKKSLVVSKSMTEFNDDDVSASFFGEAYFYCGFKTHGDSFVGGGLGVGCRQLSSPSSVGFGYGKFTAYSDVELGNKCDSNTTIYGNISLSPISNSISFKDKSITFPSKAGTLALTSDIPSVPDVSGFLKYKKVPIDFDVPADCTAFFTASGLGVCSDNVISLGLFQKEPQGKYDCIAIKQVPADVWAWGYAGEKFIVEKSSAFAISSTDGYEIRAAYYE